MNSTAVKRIKLAQHSLVPQAMLMWDKPKEIQNRRAREAAMYAQHTTR